MQAFYVILKKQYLVAQELLRRGATQMSAAKRVGVDQSTISRWIRDRKIRVPKHPTGPRSSLRDDLRSEREWTVKKVMHSFNVSRWAARRALIDIGRVYQNGRWSYPRWSRARKSDMT